jgi:PAS domain S-box-containing protein
VIRDTPTRSVRRALLPPLAATAGLVLLLTVWIAQQATSRNHSEHARLRAENIARSVQSIARSASLEELDRHLKALREIGDVREILILAGDPPTVIASSSGTAEERPPDHGSPAEASDPLVVIEPLQFQGAGSRAGTVVVRLDPKDAPPISAVDLILWLATILGGVGTITGAGWLLVRHLVLRPLAQIEKSVRNRKFEGPLKIRALAVEELNHLAKTFSTAINAARESAHHLRSSEQRFRQVAANIDEVFWLIDVGTGEFLYISPACEQFTGHSTMRLTGSTDLWFEAVHPDDREAFSASVAAGRPFNGNLRMIRTDGAVRTLSVRSRKLEEDGGRQQSLVGIGRDISESIEAKRRLDDSARDERAALHELELQRFAIDQHAIVSVADARGRITFVNDKLCSISGYSREDLIGQDHRLLNSGHHSKEFFADLFRTISRGDVWNGEIRNRARSGSCYWVHTTIVPIAGDDGKPARYMSIRTDITALKETEFALLKSNAKTEAASSRLQEAIAAAVEMAEEADRANKAKSEFLAMMSHEIRTPLNGIIGMTELTLGTELTPEQRNYLDMVRSASGNLLVIVGDVLDFSKIEAGRVELDSSDFSLTELVRGTIGLLKPRADKAGLEIGSVLRIGDCDRFVGDRVRLQQILTNLVSNAVKFTHSGRVFIEVLRGESPADNPSRCPVQFSVRDTGIGIAPEMLEHIFEPFTQADSSITRKYGGTGLGLTICRRLCGLMGGKIWVESVLGEGTTFHFQVSLDLPEVPARSATQTTREHDRLAEVMDYEAAVRNSGGEPETLQEICRIFLGELPDQLESLHGAVHRDDWARATNVAQNLTASLGLLASNGALDAAQGVHRGCTARDKQTTLLAYVPLEEELSRLALALQKLPGEPDRNTVAV